VGSGGGVQRRSALEATEFECWYVIAMAAACTTTPSFETLIITRLYFETDRKMGLMS
jgi:hypothetical protein